MPKMLINGVRTLCLIAHKKEKNFHLDFISFIDLTRNQLKQLWDKPFLNSYGSSKWTMNTFEERRKTCNSSVFLFIHNFQKIYKNYIWISPNKGYSDSSRKTLRNFVERFNYQIFFSFSVSLGKPRMERKSQASWENFLKKNQKVTIHKNLIDSKKRSIKFT